MIKKWQKKVSEASLRVNFYQLSFWVIFSFSFILKVLPILNYNFPFTTDQGRDMLDIRDIVVGHHLRLIGPTTSINGVFLGPGWYYFNVPPFILGQGDPAVLVYWQILFFQLAALAIWFFYYHHAPKLGLILSVLFLLSPAMFYQSRYSWNANPIPFFLIFFFLLLLKTKAKVTLLRLLALGLLIGLSFQIDAALTITFLPFAILFLTVDKFGETKLIPALKKFLILIFGFGLTLLPQILFEFRHQFLNTRAFWAEITGKTNILGDKLSLPDRFSSHLLSFSNVNGGTLELSHNLNIYVLLLATFFMLLQLYRKKLEKENKQIFLLSLSFIVFSFTFYLFYAYPIKSWYLIAITIPYLFIIGSALTEVIRLNKKLIFFISAVFLLLIFNSWNVQTKLIPKGLADRSGDRSNFRNEIEGIDWIYQKANGQPFKLFNYMPSVYDFPYQYIVWWYATKKYGYQPDTISYLPNVPEYIPANDSFLTKKRLVTTANYPTFLLIEQDMDMPIRQYRWLGSFSKLCEYEFHQFYWSAEIKVLGKCK